MSIVSWMLAAAALAGEWSPCPPGETTHCAEVDVPTGSDVEGRCCVYVHRESVPVGVADIEALRVAELWVARTEVTRGVYTAILGDVGPRLWSVHPSPTAGVDRARLPATHLTWYDAVLFANALSTSQGLEPVYEVRGEDVRERTGRTGWRLPTGAEWDRAANTLGVPASTADRPTETRPVCAAGEPADRLCDMASNAWEWTFDREKPDKWDPHTDAEVHDCRDNAKPCWLRASTRLAVVGFRLVRRAP